VTNSYSGVALQEFVAPLKVALLIDNRAALVIYNSHMLCLGRFD
jgi:hypothetical protein